MITDSQQHFNTVAKEWDKDKMHQERSMAIATALQQMIPLQKNWKALEYGAGTGLLSFILKIILKQLY